MLHGQFRLNRISYSIITRVLPSLSSGKSLRVFSVGDASTGLALAVELKAVFVTIVSILSAIFHARPVLEAADQMSNCTNVRADDLMSDRGVVTG